MMKVIIATLKNFPECANNCNFQIHEKSIFLTNQQQQNLKSDDVTWVDDINKANSNPTIFLANEFFDALPVKQFFRKKKDWFERFVDLKESAKTARSKIWNHKKHPIVLKEKKRIIKTHVNNR